MLVNVTIAWPLCSVDAQEWSLGPPTLSSIRRQENCSALEIDFLGTINLGMLVPIPNFKVAQVALLVHNGRHSESIANVILISLASLSRLNKDRRQHLC